MNALFSPARPRQRGSCLARLALVGLLPLLLPALGLALDPAKHLTQYNSLTWTRQNGLPVNGINAIAQSPDGFLWLGTSVGLLRFDGTDFKLTDLAGIPGLQGSTVLSIANARDGDLWVGLENAGYGRYDGTTFTFHGHPTRGGLNMNVRTILETADGTLWLASQRAAARITPSGEYEEVLTWTEDFQINILRAFEDSKGRLWFGTSRNGAFYWQNGRLTKLDDPAVTTVVTIAEDRAGRLWFGSDAGLICYDADLRVKTVSPVSTGIRALLVDRHGVLWIGTSDQGLVRLIDGVYESLRKIDGLAGEFVGALAEDREGNLWIGTPEGLTQLADVKFATVPAAEGANGDYAGAVAPSRRGGIWIGSRLGLSYYDGTMKTYTAADGLPPGAVKRVFEASNGDVYFVSGLRTLSILAEGKLVAVHPASNLVVGMAEDAQGVIVSVGGELFRASRTGFTPYVFRGVRPGFAWILNLSPGRDGAIWVACETGVFRVKDGTFEHRVSAENRPDSRAQGVSQDEDGVVWVWLLNGVLRIEGETVTEITRDDGLFDDRIHAIVADDFGYLWMDSSRGIFRVRRQTVSDYVAGRIARIECEVFDGLDSVKLSDKTLSQERVAARSLDGRIWFPSAKGVVVIDPAQVPTNRVAPSVHIDRVIANRRALPLGVPATIPPGAGELEFRFTAPSFVAPQKTRFRYRLEGYESNWVQAGNRRLAYYTNLPPGRYTFRVAAANADGVWSSTDAVAKVQLRPYFHQTAWFYAGCVLLGGGILAGFYFWRIRHLREKQQALLRTRAELELEVRHRTAELATANDSLQREAEHHQRTASELKERTQLLIETSRQAGMAEVATSVLHNVGNVLNSVNVSATLVTERVTTSKIAYVPKLGALLQDNAADLATFFAHDPKGRRIPGYLAALGEDLLDEQRTVVAELGALRTNIEHIKSIVAMQQSLAKVSGVAEPSPLVELVEEAIRMNSSSLARHEVAITRDFQANPVLTIERHKVMQILINLLRNASQACDEAPAADKQIVVRTLQEGDCVRIMIVDNGVGIASQNLRLIFSHGFTTKKSGHGFGLHSAALTARELGGSLTAHSEGAGSGAVFTLQLPLTPPSPSSP